MPSRSLWNRREVLKGTAAAGLTALAGRSAFPQVPRHLAYVGSDEGSIHVFAAGQPRWTLLQTIASAHPAALALHPSGGTLYVANEIDNWRGLPCGSVEAFAIARNGRLTQQSEQPLSLSGTLPRGLAVSPDGRSLAVAIYGGGAYNLLPIADDGSLGRVHGIVKETGFGPHPEHQRAAHPHTVAFDATGKYLLGTDAGSDRFTLLRAAEDGLERVGKRTLAAGSGPGQFVRHPAGRLLFVANHLQPSITCLASEADSLSEIRTLHTLPLAHAPVSLAIHPSGDLLFTSAADGVTAWSVHPSTGALRPIAARAVSSAGALTIDPEGGCLYVLGSEIQQLPFEASGHLGRPRTVATRPLARSIVLRPGELKEAVLPDEPTSRGAVIS